MVNGQPPWTQTMKPRPLGSRSCSLYLSDGEAQKQKTPRADDQSIRGV